MCSVNNCVTIQTHAYTQHIWEQNYMCFCAAYWYNRTIADVCVCVICRWGDWCHSNIAVMPIATHTNPTYQFQGVCGVCGAWGVCVCVRCVGCVWMWGVWDVCGWGMCGMWEARNKDWSHTMLACCQRWLTQHAAITIKGNYIYYKPNSQSQAKNNLCNNNTTPHIST